MSRMKKTGATIDMMSSENMRSRTMIRTYMNIHAKFVSVSSAATAISSRAGRKYLLFHILSAAACPLVNRDFNCMLLGFFIRVQLGIIIRLLQAVVQSISVEYFIALALRAISCYN